MKTYVNLLVFVPGGEDDDFDPDHVQNAKDDGSSGGEEELEDDEDFEEDLAVLNQVKSQSLTYLNEVILQLAFRKFDLPVFYIFCS